MGIADRKAREFKRREEDIIQAAFDLFAEHGVESVTIDMIAEEAEVGKGTIYKHFGSKTDIFAVLIKQQEDELSAGLAGIDTNAPVIVQMKQVMRLFWDTHVTDLRKFAVFRKCHHMLLLDDLTPEFLQEFTRQHELKHQFIRTLCQRAIDEQIFMEKSVDNLVAAAMGLFSGIFDTLLAGEIAPSEELYEIMESMLFKGLMR
ncbi:MAG: TetR/AcrR family transcriptional regulator [Desulfobacteraceae bacterium]|nr:TetR/AcrR family transcriptional regulator [Desulfobacteraceae bacterium]